MPNVGKKPVHEARGNAQYPEELENMKLDQDALMICYELNDDLRFILPPGGSAEDAISSLGALLDDWRAFEAHPDISAEVDERFIRWTTDKENVAKQYGFLREAYRVDLEREQTEEQIACDRWDADSEQWMSAYVGGGNTLEQLLAP